VRKAALYIQGRIVIADSHLEAYRKLTLIEQESDELVSGFFDQSTEEFCADCEKDHFFNKEMVLVRHATVSNQDDPDPSLSELGFRQAYNVGRMLMKFDLDSFEMISSPMLRCLQTASVLSETLGKKFKVDPQLAETPTFLEDEEIYCVPNRKNMFPDFMWESEEDIFLVKESSKEFRKRTAEVLHYLPNNTILVTHFGLICNMMRLALCDERANRAVDRGIPPASVTHINKEELQILESHSYA
jgi:broad specificity phosphatase PhoE